MAGKKFAKAVVGLGAVAVAGKIGYEKYKAVKERYTKEENESIDADIKKYNTIFGKKIVEIEDEEFTGCEVKTVGSKTVIDLGLAVFEKDVYVNFTSTASTVTIILPEGVNVICDIEKTLSGVRNLIENTDEEGVHTVYIIGKAIMSNVEVIPVNFYVDDDEDYEDVDFGAEAGSTDDTETDSTESAEAESKYNSEVDSESDEDSKEDKENLKTSDSEMKTEKENKTDNKDEVVEKADSESDNDTEKLDIDEM